MRFYHFLIVGMGIDAVGPFLLSVGVTTMTYFNSLADKAGIWVMMCGTQ